jgi:hypothetical protein
MEQQQHKQKVKKQKSTESKPTQCRDCAWWTFFTESVDCCNGYKKTKCKVYGESGLLAPPDMNSKEVEQDCNNRQKLQQKISKKWKEI